MSTADCSGSAAITSHRPSAYALDGAEVIGNRSSPPGLCTAAHSRQESGLDYLAYYHLEDYLFSTVCPRFHRDKYLSAFDFFSIIRWKSNRARPKVVAGLLEGSHTDLDTAVRALTQEIYEANNHEVRFKILIDRPGIGLPTATAILTVLYPEEFTVYDVRVCDALGDFHNIGNRTNPTKIWEGYEEFREEVRKADSPHFSLRAKDRWLWAKTVVEQMECDIKNGFNRSED